ncbi:HWE histidine kinase domain-containing protein [Marivita sp.]|uniref:HWE histidine kinase domain-containing protein n=1 Tax=Marivita sp. TaxID=2003365 RepID=UPI0025BCB930|nr:HWE histidine kinase domain-containing protein [Marivita sp.]
MNIQKSTDFAEFPTELLPDHYARLADPDRLHALAETGVMHASSEDVFDRAVRLASNLLGVPVGLASFVSDTRQVLKAQCGLPEGCADLRETPLSHSFCQYVVAHDRPLAVSDAREHPLLHSNPAIQDLGIVAYLGAPIHAPSGAAVGAFCAIDHMPRNWTRTDAEALTDLGRTLETELQLRHERDAMQTLARELNHRVKNLFSVVGGMISLTARSADSAQDMARVLHGRLSALSSAHGMISPALSDGKVKVESIDLHSLLDRLVQPHLHPGRTQLFVDLPTLGVSGQTVTDLALVIHELATNAAKYGALSVADGTVTVNGVGQGDEFRLVWRETGGPDIAEPPSPSGFGSRLIDLTVARQIGGAFDSTWHRSGVEHVLTLPRSVFDTEDAAGAA